MNWKTRTARDLLNLQRDRQGLNWYKIVNKADGPTQLMIYDEIGFWGMSAQDLIQELQNVKGPLDVHINSPGGEVFDGIAIYNALRQRGQVTTVVDSIAASIASVIAMAGDEVLMSPHSQLMIHDGFGLCMGNAADMRELADLLDKQSDNIAGIYADRSGKPASYWRDLMRNETWYSDQEAVDEGLADKIVGKNSPQNSARPKKNRKNKRPVEPAYNADVDNSPWDGPAAMQRALHSDDPEAAFRSICAGEKTVGQPDEEAHWALPHHKDKGGPPNAKGVSSALGYLDRTNDLKDPAAARAHLEAHDKAIQGGSSDSADNQLAAMAEALKGVLSK